MSVMKKSVKTIIVAAMLTVLLIGTGTLAAAAGEVTRAEAGTDMLKIEFNDTADLNYFNAYYSANGAYGTQRSVDTLFEIDNGVLRSLTQPDSNKSAENNMSTLHLKEYGFQQLELSFDYRKLSGNGYAALIAKLRKPEMASYDDTASSYYYGVGAYVLDNGTAVIKGGGRNLSSSISNRSVSGYDSAAWHNIKLRCFNQSYKMYIDDVLIYDLGKAELGGESILGGFIGLQTANCIAEFDNFTLRTLDNSGEYTALEPQENIIRVACVGDSLSFGSGAYNEDGEYDQRYIYAGHLQKSLGEKNYTVRNFGVGGRTAMQGTGSCIMDDPEYYFAQRFRADIICIMLGTNDSADIYWTGTDAQAAARFTEGYALIIEGLLQFNPDAKIYILTAPWMAGEIPGLCDSLIAERARKHCKTFAQENGYTVIDTYTDTFAAGAQHQYDGIHFDSYGYSLIAKNVFNQMVKDNNESVTYANNNITLNKGESYELGYTTKIKPTFTSSAASVAEVDENGVITAKAVGRTVIKAALGAKSANIVVNVVEKVAPQITNVNTASAQWRYGEELPQLTCTATVGGENVAGSITLDASQQLITGTHDYNWTFVPDDETKYLLVQGTVSITVLKAIPNASAPQIAEQTLKTGMQLKDIQLPDGFTWKEPTASVKEGQNSATVSFTPTDSANYETVEFTISFNSVKENTETSSGCKSATTASSLFFALAGLSGMFLILKSKRRYGK